MSQKKANLNINFMGQRKRATVLSAVMLLASLIGLFINGLNLGLDFTGGTQVRVQFERPVSLDTVRKVATEEGFSNPVVVYYGSESEVMIRFQGTLEGAATGADAVTLGDSLVEALEEATGQQAALQDSSYVGSQVGDQMADNAVVGLLVALAIVMLYVALRFQYKFAVGAVVALAHDVLIVVGVFALFRLDVDLTVFAAVLAVIGYSLNDTIVVSDRIRENFRKVRKGSSIDIINISLNQTVGRTLITSLTTLLVLFALLFFGGEVIRGFSLALIVGIVVGTYSSVYVAANVMLAMHISKEDLLVPVKEGAELEERP
jgi:preprotein translocase subunit SecF